MKISILSISISIMGVLMAHTSEMSIPLIFAQLSEDTKDSEQFLLKARVIVKDPNTEQVEIKLKSENVAQEKFYDKNLDDNSKTRLKFKFNEAFNAPYEICAESVQDKDVYACKGGLLETVKPNLTLHI